MRLAVLTTHPIQYQAPIWRGLAEYDNLELHVYFGSDFSVRGYHDRGFGRQISWDVPLTEGYPHTFLSREASISAPNQLNLDRRDLQQRLKSFRPDWALINGYLPARFYMKGLFVLRGLKVPVLLRAEASDEALPRGPLKTLGRNLVLRGVYSKIDRFLAIGENARRHYLAKGVDEEKIYWSPYCVDSGFFAKQIERYLPQRTEIRRRLGFAPSQTVFLFSGKFIPKKDPLILPSALKQLKGSETEMIGLLIVGDGLLREKLETELETIPKIKHIFTGFQNQSKIGKYYAAADCLVLPSKWGETWGLVVNEALQFGLPAIVSDRVGCRHDLIHENETGFVFPAGDAVALAMRMEQVALLTVDKRELVSDSCRRKAAEYSLEKSIAGINAALKCQ
jgi:glycosyltransferase involved in cell wall biosynthesis